MYYLKKQQVAEIIKVLKKVRRPALQNLYFPEFEEGKDAAFVMTDSYILIRCDIGQSNPVLSGKVIPLERLIGWHGMAKSNDFINETWLLNNYQDPTLPYPDTSKLIPCNLQMEKEFDGVITLDAKLLLSIQKICLNAPSLAIINSNKSVYFFKDNFEGVILPMRTHDKPKRNSLN